MFWPEAESVIKPECPRVDTLGIIVPYVPSADVNGSDTQVLIEKCHKPVENKHRLPITKRIEDTYTAAAVDPVEEKRCIPIPNRNPVLQDEKPKEGAEGEPVFR